MTTVLVSPAERDPLLHALGPVSSVCERLGVDFLFHARGKLIGIQRKEVRDLVASLRNDDRIARELGQMEALAQAVLIVEGNWGWNARGESTRVRGFTRANYRGVMLSLQANGVWVLTTESTADTAEALVGLEAWFAHAEHDSLRRRKKPSRGGQRDPDWRHVHTLQSVDGISYVRAKAIVAHFGGLPLRLTCTEQELAGVSGVGPITAKKLLAAFNGGTNGTH